MSGAHIYAIKLMLLKILSKNKKDDMEKLNFIYKNDGKTVAEFDSDSEKYMELINVAIKELQKVIHLKGHIYDSTLTPTNRDNFQDDMKTLMSCDLAIRTLKTFTKQEIEQ